MYFCRDLPRDNDITGVLDHTFCVEHNAYGEIIQHELKPNGKSIPVTEDTKKEYVRCEEDRPISTHLHTVTQTYNRELSLNSTHMVTTCSHIFPTFTQMFRGSSAKFSIMVVNRCFFFPPLWFSAGCMWTGVSCMALRLSFWPCRKASMKLSLNICSSPLTRRN